MTSISLQDFDVSKFRLGKLCNRGHDWVGTGQSLRYVSNSKCIECAKERANDRYAANTERGKECAKKWRAANPEKARECVRKYRAANREKARKLAKKYQAANPEKARECTKKCRTAKPDLYLALDRRANQKRRALEHEAHTYEITPQQLQARLELFNNQCCYCLTDFSDKELHWDHFVPLSQGGTHNLGNLLPACEFCNCSKHAKDAYEWYSAQPSFKPKQWKRILAALGKTEKNYNQLPLI